MKVQVKAISAVTLTTADTALAIAFCESPVPEQHRGGPTATFSIFSIGSQHINLRLVDQEVDPLQSPDKERRE